MKNASIAVIVSNGEVVDVTETDLPNGSSVRYGFQSCREEINANRERNLVNAFGGKISRSKASLKKATRCDTYFREINDGEFLAPVHSSFLVF